MERFKEFTENEDLNLQENRPEKVSILKSHFELVVQSLVPGIGNL